MLNRALCCQSLVELYCIKYEENKEDLLAQQDQRDLKNIASILKSFADATLATKGYSVSINLTLQLMDFLLYKFKQAKVKYCLDPFLGPCCNASQKKLDKYYGMTERTAAYSAALVLCPRYKWTYFDGKWPKDQVRATRLQVEDLQLREYKTTAVSDAI